MSHKVIIYTHPEDINFSPAVEHEFEDFIDAEILAFNHWSQTGNLEAARIFPDYQCFSSLADYLSALNAEANFVEENPIHGNWVPALCSDIAFWAEAGVKTPEDMARYLAIECYHDVHKEHLGFRPREDLSSLSIHDIQNKTLEIAVKDLM